MSVYCSYCGQRGHNRLGCPQRKKAAREDPEGYIGRQVKREQEARQRAVASRTCSYCNEPGHNRRGCPVLKKDKELLAQTNYNFREKFHDLTAEHGFGSGALVKVSSGPRQDPWSRYYVGLVTDIHWENIDFVNHQRSISDTYYAGRGRQVASVRVVKSVGWNEHDRWDHPPASGSLSYLQAVHLAPLLGDNPDNSAAANGRAQVLSGVNVATTSPPSIDHGINDNINDAFNLSPSPRAKDWEKSRLPKTEKLWSDVYPEYFEERIQNILDKN